MSKKEVLIIKNIAAFENLVNRDDKAYDLNMMIMPGTLEDKHKGIDPERGIRALRRQFNLIYLLTEGEHDVLLGADYQWLKPNDLVIVPENMVYASKHIRNCKGFCIHFKTEFIQTLLSKGLAEDFSFFNFDAIHIINVSQDESNIIQQAFKDILKEYEIFSCEKDFILRNFIHILLLRIREIYRPHVQKINDSSSRMYKLAMQFKHKVERNFVVMREVKNYAQEMNISPKHLYEAVRATFGKSPKIFIQDMLLLEAKVQLGSTDKSISEIAHSLQFLDQSHFNHFIKQQTGFTPTELRSKL